ncbi:MAG TPA: DUF748 domain-containing protein [Geobacteraceae bacterium]
MKRWQKWTAGAGAFVVLSLGFIAFVLPGIVRSKAVEGIAAKTGRRAAIARVVINPLTWTVRVEGFRLREKGSDVTFASFSSVRVRVSPRSLFRLAPIVSEAQLTAPYVHIVRTAANAYNFSDLLEGKKEENKKPLHFSLNNITIANGSVDFIDRAIPAEKRHTLRRIEVGIPFISNIPYLADRYVLPRFGAVVNGSPLNLEGKLKPFVKGAEMAFDVNLKDLSLPFYFSYYPGTPPVQMDSGRLTTTLEVVHRVTAGNKPELEVKGDVVLADLKMRDRDGAPLLSLVRGRARISRAQVMARDFALSALVVDGPEMYLARDRQGVWNFQRLAAGEKPAEKEGEPAAAPRPLVAIGDIRLEKGRLHVADSLPPGGFTTELTDIALGVTGLSTAPGKKGGYTLAFATARGEKGTVKGDFSVEPLAASAAVEMKELLLDAYYPYLADALTAPVKGRLDMAAAVAYTAADGLKLSKGSVEARQLGVSFGREDGAKLARLAVSGVSADLKGRTAEVEKVTLQDGTVRVSRAANGRLSPLALLRAPKKAAAPARGKKGGEAPFRYKVKGVTGSGLNVAFTDRMKEDAPLFLVRKLNFSVSGITGPRLATMPFRVAAGYGGKGSIRASGSLTPVPFRLKGECDLRRIGLADFDPYLPDNLNMTVAGGSLDTKLRFTLAKGKGGMTGSFRGGLGVRSFHTLDADGEDLLKWESLELDTLRGTLGPFALDVAGVALNKFYARIVVAKNGALNLKELYAPEEGKETAKPAATPESAPAAKPTAAKPPAAAAGKGTVRIDTVTLQDGTVAFIDRHTQPEYASTMVNLGGRISGLSSEANQLADVDLRGNLENQSPLRITGRINPLRDDLFVDLKVSFTDIELSPFTPYAGTFLGYAVDKGKLYLDLKYHIENKKLDSENKLFLDQFTFGRKVESDRATGLPVRLAVALLKDRKGEIHLDLPVAGRTDDPKFSVWGVVLKMLKNLLAKAATAPLALLQSAFGGKEDFSGVGFAHGSARLSAAEQAKLRKLAQAIHDRPALKLEVTGFVDRERDPEGYRGEVLLRKMKSEKFLALVKEKKNREGESAETMEILPTEQSAWLKAVYRKEKFPKPRTIIGLVKDIPDDEMRKLILTHTVVGDAEMQGLARERAVAVRNFLVAEGKLPPERIFEKKGDMFKAPAREGESASRVEFGVAVQ